MELKINELKPHRRYNPLTGEWVIVSPGRMNRPWKGRLNVGSQVEIPQYDPNCPFCPGNIQSNGIKNPNYTGVYSFYNAIPFFCNYENNPVHLNFSDLMIANEERGVCKVMCFSERHDLSLSLMTSPQIEKVVDAWVQETLALSQTPHINYVQILENRGELVGSGIPHPHGQILASETIPFIPGIEQQNFNEYYKRKKACLLCDYMELEKQYQERKIFENEYFMVVVPFWAFWPYETLVISKFHVANILNFGLAEKKAFAETLKELFTRYDNLFEMEFPYIFGIHQSPVPDAKTIHSEYPEWHFHVHVSSPLLDQNRKKYAASIEMFATSIRDITPEVSAERLRGLSNIHYKNIPR